jgi:hypothetical protein
LLVDGKYAVFLTVSVNQPSGSASLTPQLLASTMLSLSSGKKSRLSRWLDDPVVQATSRTYSLALTLSLAPALIPFAARRGELKKLLNVLKRELGPTGFAFSMTVAVSGGALLQRILSHWSGQEFSSIDQAGSYGRSHHDTLFRRRLVSTLSPRWRAFISNMVSSFITILLLQRGARHRRAIRRRHDIPLTPDIGEAGKNVSPTLDLTLLFFVRAMDVLMQCGLRDWWPTEPADSKIQPKKKAQASISAPEQLSMHVDAFLFWACSARFVAFRSAHLVSSR